MSSDESKYNLITMDTTNRAVSISFESIKNDYIVDGSDPADLAKKYKIPVSIVTQFITENELDKLRAAHIKHGLDKLKNVQVGQAEKLMNIETQFKKMRIVQLEKSLEDYLAYYSKYGHFYKIHPLNGEILNDTNGMPIQIKIPNVTKEIEDLKLSVTMSEGLTQILGRIDQIINKPKDTPTVSSDIIDITSLGGLFEKRKPEDD